VSSMLNCGVEDLILYKNYNFDVLFLVDQGNGRSKRKADDGVTISETPKLFSSRFKVPKLKNGS